MYAWPCSRYSPSFEHLSEAVATLNIYGLPVSTFLTPNSPLFDALLAYAPTRPLDLYALSASFRIHQLAVSASPHLLSLPLCSLTDDMALKIGPIYLKKLFFLHLGRLEALKQLLHPPPPLHDPTPTCGYEEQRKLRRSWALASSYLMWNAQPDTSPNTIDKTLCSLANHLTCDLCKLSLQDRIRSLAVQWSVVKVNICCSSVMKVNVLTYPCLCSALSYDRLVQTKKIPLSNPCAVMTSLVFVYFILLALC